MTTKGNKKLKTVFLLDDETSWLEIMSEVLKQEHYHVITADNGEEALRKLEKTKPDLILSDLRMPIMNGYDFFEKVRSIPKLSSVPFVFMSSIDDYDAKKVAKQLGADAYIEKPFDTRDAKATVADLLSRFKNR